MHEMGLGRLNARASGKQRPEPAYRLAPTLGKTPIFIRHDLECIHPSTGVGEWDTEICVTLKEKNLRMKRKDCGPQAYMRQTAMGLNHGHRIVQLSHQLSCNCHMQL